MTGSRRKTTVLSSGFTCSMELKGKARCRFRSKPRWRTTIWSGGRAVHSGRGRANRGACRRLQRPGSQRRQRAGVQAPPPFLGSALHPGRRSLDHGGSVIRSLASTGVSRGVGHRTGRVVVPTKADNASGPYRDGPRSLVRVGKVRLGRRCARHVPAALSVPARSRTRPSRLQRGSCAPGRGSFEIASNAGSTSFTITRMRP